jgi:hypothetical protein
MKTQPILLTIGLSAALIGLTGCNKPDTTSTDTTGATNTMATEVKDATSNVVAGAESAGAAVKDEAVKGADAVAAGAEKAGTEIKEVTTNAVAEVKDKMDASQMTNTPTPPTNSAGQ